MWFKVGCLPQKSGEGPSIPGAHPYLTCLWTGAPGRTRTCGTEIRNLVLYPPELRGPQHHEESCWCITQAPNRCQRPRFGKGESNYRGSGSHGGLPHPFVESVNAN